ncbi:uncharacterized protein LOC126866789 [Bombus huntii]|uniref:uncharacterized protein LOC126866789 n=1 Tax=Bombus huntii TaxID=85661 RepID=UPI0021A9B9BA|nr:uncharacterized protein LOC126866789 [Bombus huntii]
MANVGDERLSGEEGSTLEELRSKLARMNLPISGARSVLIARLNRACRAGQSYRKGSTGGEELTGQRDLENVQRAERDCNEDEDVEKMNTKELKERLASLGLKTTGRKVELRARLQAAMDGNDISSEEESDDESEDEDDKKNARGYKRDTRRVYQDRDECCRRACVGSTLNFRDVEDALESFSGNRGENVERWFESFEEVADTCMWSDGQKAVYARKLLKGSAKIFASFECHARTWHELKRGLVKEFSRKVNSRQVHQKLEETKKESDEACLAYMCRMLEIASHVDMEEEAKVEYIVDGIIDDENDKAILYGATSIKELRKRLVMYEEQKSRRAKSIVKPAKTQKNGKPSQSVDAMKKRRCFICGSEDYPSVKCPERGEGVRCFECSGFGHIAARCTARPKETCVVSRSEKGKYVKEVAIDDCRFVALVDTGSDLTFIRSDEYARLGSPPLGKCKFKFDGFGSAGNETWGEFTKVMTVDGCKLPITLHVVSNKILTKHGLLLGTDFLDQVELRVKRSEVTFLRLDEQTNKDVSDVFRINVVEQTDETDLTHVQEPHYREAIRDIVRGYRPEKKRDVGITAKVVLESDKPAARRPRRLAPSERKEEDDLMEVWTNEGVIKSSDSEYASPIGVVRKKDLCVRVARWALLLGEFKYQVCHRPGKSMQHVNAPSRNPLPSTIYVTESEDGLIARLRRAQNKDIEVRRILDAATCSQADGQAVRNNILYKERKDDVLIVVLKAMRAEVVRQAHERGHFEVTKTEAMVKKDFWFRGLREKVEHVVSNCLDCSLTERNIDALLLPKNSGFKQPEHKKQNFSSNPHLISKSSKMQCYPITHQDRRLCTVQTLVSFLLAKVHTDTLLRFTTSLKADAHSNVLHCAEIIRFFEFSSGMVAQFSSGRLTINYYLDESGNGKSKFSGKCNRQHEKESQQTDGVFNYRPETGMGYCRLTGHSFCLPQLRSYETGKFSTDNTTVIPYPPCSPNLALGNFFSFSKMKSKAKGQCFCIVEKVQEASQRGNHKEKRDSKRRTSYFMQHEYGNREERKYENARNDRKFNKRKRWIKRQIQQQKKKQQHSCEERKSKPTRLLHPGYAVPAHNDTVMDD